MEEFTRFAVYYAPRPGAFADRAAAWLGWDAALGKPAPHPALDGLDLADLTAEPRKYGFHGTIRAPFRPGEGQDRHTIAASVGALAARLPPVSFPHLRLQDLHGFLALTPEGDTAALLRLGAAVVEGTDSLRAPLTEAEIARRRPDQLTRRQRALLLRWGYPGVMEAFEFHLTLTGRLSSADAVAVARLAEVHFAPVLPHPFVIADLCLFAETAAGRFHLLHRYALSG